MAASFRKQYYICSKAVHYNCNSTRFFVETPQHLVVRVIALPLTRLFAETLNLRLFQSAPL